MPDIDINDVASQGLILDIPGYQLPPEAWTTAQDVRIIDDGVRSGATWTPILDTSVAPGPASPVFLQSVRTFSQSQWLLYASLTDLYAWDGSTTAKVSGTDAPYTTSSGYSWNGTQLAGIPVLTNNSNPPQYWQALSLGSTFAELPGWTAVMGAAGACRAIQAFGPYLVALNVLIQGVQHPHGVVWSHPADPGTMPASWDFNNPNFDAGFTELTDASAGVVVDGLPLRNLLVIYKEHATWIMRLVGGQYIMQFDPFLMTQGILTNHCVALTGDGKYHFVVTDDDIIIHDGVSAQSILDRRMRRTLFNRISAGNYILSHCFAVPSKREMWFVYAEAGMTQVSRALVWNYGAGVGTNGVLYECAFTFPSAAIADLVDPSDTWSSDTDPWAQAIEQWSQTGLRRTVLADATNQKILAMDIGVTRSGAAFTGIVQRVPVSMVGQRRTDGQPVVDWSTRKFVRRIWPKAEGGLLTVRLGFCHVPGGPVTWTNTKTFDPTQQSYVDFVVNDKGAPTVEFSWVGTQGALYGYRMEVSQAGRF